MKRLRQLLPVAFLKGLSCLPFFVLYLVSDLLYPLILVIGYRKKVVYRNLRNAFPEKSGKEIQRTARRFYRHFCDLILESVKLYRMTEKELDRRFLVTGLEKINAYADEGRGVIIIGMHYNNWEWGSSIQRLTRQKVLIAYKPLKNKFMELFMLRSRERFGSLTVSVADTVRTALRMHREGKPACLFLAADQTPRQTHFWTTFLNQETPFFSGPEHLSVKLDQPVFFQHTVKLSRGRYEVRHAELFPHPREVEPAAILLAYIRKTEQIIRENPEYWLWSHNRWKRGRPEGVPLVKSQTS